MREITGRVLFWFPLATAVAAAAFSIFFFAYSETGVYGLDLGVGALATATAIAPGIVISCVVNQVLLFRRTTPRAVSIAEAILFVVQAAAVGVLIAQAFDQWSFAAIPLTPVIVGLAIATTALLARRPKTTAPKTTALAVAP